jgi:methylated-DNA-[protein]-cysteine S-methyltransferase
VSAFWEVYESPLGPLTLHAGEHGLAALTFPGRARALAEEDRRPELLAPAVEQLEQYFAGARRSFELELELEGSAFEQRIWERLRDIPYGATLSYGRLAHAVGRPDIVRGVAAAVGRTPVPIIIPCHRVVGARGELTGYGGGLGRKRALLELEGAAIAWDARQLTLI